MIYNFANCLFTTSIRTRIATIIWNANLITRAIIFPIASFMAIWRYTVIFRKAWTDCDVTFIPAHRIRAAIIGSAWIYIFRDTRSGCSWNRWLNAFIQLQIKNISFKCKLTCCLTTTSKRVTCKPIFACTKRIVILNGANRVRTTGIFTRIYTFLINASFISSTFGWNGAHWFTIRRNSDETRQTRANCNSIAISALTIWAARGSFACINFLVWSFFKKKTVFNGISFSLVFQLSLKNWCYVKELKNFNFTVDLRLVMGSKKQYGVWSVTWHFSFGEQAPKHGSWHLFRMHERFDGQSLLNEHSGLQPSYGFPV